MRTIISGSFLFVFLLSIQVLFGQKDSSLSEKIVKEFCDEFSKKDFSNQKEWKMEIGMIILPIISKYGPEIKKEWNLSSDNMADYEKIAEKIGAESALGCPAFMEFIKNNMTAIMDEGDEVSAKSVSGTLVKLEEQQFACFIIKTKSGKEEKLWWFGYFDGADNFSSNKTKFLNKTVAVEYIEMEVYNPLLKDYHRIKVIKKLELN